MTSTATGTNLVVADIGGTNSRIAVVAPDGGLGLVETVSNDAADSLEAILQRFLSAHRLAPRHTDIRLAVACPVSSDRIQFTNRDWSISVSELKQKLMVAALTVVNDFTAIAVSLAYLDDDQMMAIGGGRLRSDAPKLVLGPGTGLGVAASIPLAGAWYPIGSEGGHASLAPVCRDDARIIDFVREQYGHVSSERLLSGPGLCLLYEAETALRANAQAVPRAEDITRLAATGDDPIATRVVDRFFSLLGAAAGNLALSFGARGGVYLAGGMLPQIRDLLRQSRFRETFEEKGRFRDYLSPIATRLITHPQPALLALSRPLPGGVAAQVR